MILNLILKNYRSFKEETTFTMLAESSKTKEQNVFVQNFAKGDDVKLLNTAMLYGANASGKSNLLRAVFEISRYIGENKPNVGKPIPIYDPFLFDIDTKEAPTEFCIEFVGKDNIKYKYQLSFDRINVLKEELTYWPNSSKSTILFTRAIPEDFKSIKHIGQIGSPSKSKDVEVFHNQALLSKFGEEIPHEIISEVYIYITQIEVINACNSRKLSVLFNDTKEKMVSDSNLLEKMNELLRFVDTGLNGVNIRERDEKEFNLPKDLSDSVKSEFINNNKYPMTGIHSVFGNLELIKADETLPFEDESRGTNTIFALGGRLLQAIENGEVVFVDEIETNLHPFLSKLLVGLFQNPRINKKNSQLIFTTHNTHLLDKTLFRKDQIWFTEKDKYGATNLYSLQDFSDVREDTPFDKWYLAGKFGGIPNIKSLETLFL